MKKLWILLWIIVCCNAMAQIGQSGGEQPLGDTTEARGVNVPELIPINRGGLYGYLNSKTHKVAIKPKFSSTLFFNEDCNLLNSPNLEVRQYGTADFATAMLHGKTVRIDKTGKVVYTFDKKDFGKCLKPFVAPIYVSYEKEGRYGLAKKDRAGRLDLNQIYINPIYQYTFVMDSQDKEEPMIIAIQNDKFGVLDKEGKVILPFIYADIRRNLSWREAYLFQVSLDGKHYFYIDRNRHIYK